MKILKKLLKFVAIVGALFGFAKLICEFCKTTIKMNEYNRQTVFNGSEVDYDEEPFEKDSVASLFSGVELNFEKATMKNKSSALDIFGRFSGIEVLVPDHWKVNMDGVQKSSGIEDATKDNSEDEEAPVLNINYDLKFCGLEVANPKHSVEEDVEVEDEVIEEVIEDEFEDEIVIEEIEEVIDETDEEDEDTL